MESTGKDIGNEIRSIRIKVCGMTQLDQVRELEEMGVEFAGFIFYSKSNRYVGNRITGDELKKSRLKLGKVGVFVNASYDDIMWKVDEYGLDMVQLHGDETVRFCEELANNITVVNVFRLGEDDPIDYLTRPYVEACDMFHFDTEGAGYGGTGKKFNWEMLKTASMDKLFFLGGGIEPGDAPKLKEFAFEPVAKKLFAIDINSKFELSPGIKDIDEVRKFVSELRE